MTVDEPYFVQLAIELFSLQMTVGSISFYNSRSTFLSFKSSNVILLPFFFITMITFAGCENEWKINSAFDRMLNRWKFSFQIEVHTYNIGTYVSVLLIYILLITHYIVTIRYVWGYACETNKYIIIILRFHMLQ